MCAFDVMRSNVSDHARRIHQAYVFTYVHTCIHTYIHAYMHTYIYKYTCIHVHVRVYVGACKYVSIKIST